MLFLDPVVLCKEIYLKRKVHYKLIHNVIFFIFYVIFLDYATKNCHDL